MPWPPSWKKGYGVITCREWSDSNNSLVPEMTYYVSSGTLNLTHSLNNIRQAGAEWYVCRGCLMCTLKMPKLAQYMPPKQQILLKKTWQFTSSYKDDGSKIAELKQQITKDYITSQHSDISAICCEVISSFVIFPVLVTQDDGRGVANLLAVFRFRDFTHLRRSK